MPALDNFIHTGYLQADVVQWMKSSAMDKGAERSTIAISYESERKQAGSQILLSPAPTSTLPKRNSSTPALGSSHPVHFNTANASHNRIAVSASPNPSFLPEQEIRRSHGDGVSVVQGAAPPHCYSRTPVDGSDYHPCPSAPTTGSRRTLTKPPLTITSSSMSPKAATRGRNL